MKQQLQNIKMDQLTALDAFNAIGERKLDTFSTIAELATALKPYLVLTNATASREPELEAEITKLKEENAILKKKMEEKE